ncbi:HAMP domain-containing sensor histidine kinase [Stenotrophomonas sp. 24(2023)]|uniref:sensor histidine kinase n=1 Tax=Stenotrophomonas sp. 24(2023) TaxID=3068324 RepID=UPI0027E0848E|nr:HAMP domain-containing sensor histidine kinase [Stenotrophomonas sp. 24(2023)]WMJ68620.1 HAMP domain-containing sensor histidine kinase [Stenotrophomonas sp. 24(2023)]
MRRANRSLTLGLAWRLFLAQAFTVLFAVLALIINWGDKDSLNMDMFIAEDMAALVHARGNGLVLDEARWAKLDARASGNLWLVAVDDRGQWLQRGDVPAVHAPLLARLPLLGGSELGSLTPPYLDVARVVVRSDSGRRITVMAGGAPRGGLVDGALMVLRLIGLWFFLPLIGVTLLVMPTVIHRAMRGVRRLAQQAKELDIAQPGAQLETRLVSSEVAPLVDAFNDAIVKVRQGYAARDKFLADAAHELRVPIAVVQARLVQLPQGELKSQLATDVARLANVAEHLLDLQRLDRGGSALQRVDLALVAREAAAELAPLVVGAGYGFEVDAPVQPVWIHGDGLALGRVIANLVHNAIVHGGGRGIIRVTLDGQGVLEVSDQGDGVPVGDREAIFEPFHRLRAAGSGSGLGLHLVKEIVQHHGGSVSVGEAAGGGASFRISFHRPGVRR